MKKPIYDEYDPWATYEPSSPLYVSRTPQDRSGLKPALLTLKDTAARLCSTTDQVMGLIADGELKYINVGRGKRKPRYRFHEDDIAHFIDQQRTGQEPSCLSLSRRNQRRITGSVFKSTVIGFTALRAARIVKMPKK